VLTVAKTRKVLGLRGISVCLDHVYGLGDFVEFEFGGEELEKGKEEIATLMRELDVRGNERRSYLELLLLRSPVDHQKT
jgi:predicted adenylyl cyclase CyaB